MVKTVRTRINAVSIVISCCVFCLK